MEVTLEIRRKHLFALIVIILVSLAASTVNIRDNSAIFGTLSMNDNIIDNLAEPSDSNTDAAATVGYVNDNSGNSGGDHIGNNALNWGSASIVSDADGGGTTDSASVSISCGSQEVLLDVSCHQGKEHTPCDTRNQNSAGLSYTAPSNLNAPLLEIAGTCVPVN